MAAYNLSKSISIRQIVQLNFAELFVSPGAANNIFFFFFFNDSWCISHLVYVISTTAR